MYILVYMYECVNKPQRSVNFVVTNPSCTSKAALGI